VNNTKERPIIFNAQEVNAVLAGDKTQYRVPVDIEFIKDVNVPIVQKVADETDCTLSELVTGAYNDSVYDFICPLGKAGDRLWVQELHARTENEDLLTRTHYYAGNGDLRPDLRHDAGLLTKYDADAMPRWASRLLLEITDIRIERVQDTSHDDAVAEGVHHFDIEARLCDQALSVAQIVFSRHWDTKREDRHTDWESNPWVWVVEFKKIKEVSNG